jgi:hypothetical protein
MTQRSFMGLSQTAETRRILEEIPMRSALICTLPYRVGPFSKLIRRQWLRVATATFSLIVEP